MVKTKLSKVDCLKLNYISKRIIECQKCSRIRKNGIAIPFWTTKSRVLGLAEAPGREEVEYDPPTPLVGAAGRKLFEELGKIGLFREDMMLINACQCRPVENGRNGKPTDQEIKNCRFWVDRYFHAFNPDHILAMGNYALYYLYNMRMGVTSLCGEVLDYKGAKVYPILHPASLLYSPDNVKLFRKSLDRLRKGIKL